VALVSSAIPDGWTVLPLEELAEEKGIAYGVLKPGGHRPDGVPMLRVTDVRDGQIDQKQLYYISPELDAEFSRTRLEGGEVVVSIQGSVGRVAVVPPELKGANVSRTLAMVRLKDPGLAPWVHRALESPTVQALTRELVGGTTRDSLNLRDLRRLPVPVAPEDQRPAIITAVDAALASVREAGAHLGRAEKAVDVARRSILTAACSGRLSLDWRGGQTLVTAPGPAVEPLVDTPDTWCWRRLGDLADLRGGIQKGAKLRPGEPAREVPYLRVANVQRGWLDLREIKTIMASERTISELSLKPGDVLFNEGGDRDKLGRGWVWSGEIDECIHQNHVFRARPRPGLILPRFLSWYGNTIGAKYFVDHGKQTVNLASLSMSSLKALPVPVPTWKEQEEIVGRVETLMAVCDELGARLAVGSRNLHLSSQSILLKAFQGELVSV
jgi:type I restriction enzyme S subunit